uniref:Putative glucose dehydrogenase/choline dehydrogenase/mandelonitrile lyase gmc oxidoreductase family n=1 Tax=Ixodes ricinus TaxID=34613 RepID=A0A147BDS6_IXORI
MWIGAKGLLVFNLAVIGAAVLWQHFGRRRLHTTLPESEYDYIIVGAGTAGCVLTRRLLDQADRDGGNAPSVLLLEAGHGEAPWYASVPLAAVALQASDIDWQFLTVPQKDALHSYREQRMPWPRGKALGGSSNLYCLIHSRATPKDWQDWRERCKTCDFPDHLVDAIYSKLEFHPEQNRGAPDGQIPVSRLSCSSSQLCSSFRDAAVQLGVYSHGTGDHDNLLLQNNIYNGKRWTSYDTYVKPVLTHPGLRIFTGVQVTKVLFDGVTAVGVEMATSEHQTHLVTARRDVILSAGAIGSPHLLMLSGVGPKDELARLSIPVVSEVEWVGKNLQDQVAVPMYFNMRAPISINEYKVKSVRQLWNYLWGEGLLASSGVEAALRTEGPDRDSDALFMLINIGSVNEDIFLKVSNQYREDFRASYPDTKNTSKEGFMMLVSCLHPKSAGHVTLSTDRAADPPRIDPRYFTHPHDLECTVNAMKTASRLASTAPFAKLGVSLHMPKYRHCTSYEPSMENTEYLQCWARTAAMTIGHPMGTVAMGDLSDDSSVVDAEFRVKGTRNLRVVDASVIPSQLSSTPHATVLLLAEKAAQIIGRA